MNGLSNTREAEEKSSELDEDNVRFHIKEDLTTEREFTRMCVSNFQTMPNTVPISGRNSKPKINK